MHSIFNQQELSKYFRNGKKGKSGKEFALKNSGKYFAPIFFGKEFINKLFKSRDICEKLLVYMNEDLRDQIKKEIVIKTWKILSRFRIYFEQVNYELYSSAVTNYLMGNKMPIWTISEVDWLIQLMNHKVKSILKSNFKQN